MADPLLDHLLEDPPELRYPYFDSVPKLPQENERFREELRKACRTDKDLQVTTMQMCKEDSLYWLSAFCYLFEPRPKPHVIPFVPWAHQVPVWKEMERWLGHCDVGLEKSRGEGASWMISMLCIHKWLFMPMFAAGIVSKDERSVDDPENPDSIFWKLDFCIKHLPPWMKPKFNSTQKTHMRSNLENGATISGFAATGDAASGGRKTLFVMDELAKFRRGPDKEVMNSTQYVTNCRYLISTPKGPEGAYFEAMNGKSVLKKLVLDWKQNPVRSQGGCKVLIATDDSRKIEIVDHAYWQKRAQANKANCPTTGDVIRMAARVQPGVPNEFGYDFMMTGPFVKHDQLRSPWYDWECQRPTVTPSDIAQELDRDYGGSASRFFDINMLMRLQNNCRPPDAKGDMKVPANVESHIDLDKPKFVYMHGGKLSLWFKPDLAGRVPPGRNYVIGADISSGGSGVGTSNSALCVLDQLTGRQVAEFVSPQLIPTELADYAVSMCYWFQGNSGPAMLIWEANGPNGAQFGSRIIQLGYGNVYFRGQTEEYSERETKKVGFWTSGKTKPAILGEWGRALDAGNLEINSADCLDEAKFYVNQAGGRIEHIAESTEKDPSGAGERHGDRVIASALAWWVVKDYILSGKSADALAANIPVNCALGRRRDSQNTEKGPIAWVPPSQKRFKNFRG